MDSKLVRLLQMVLGRRGWIYWLLTCIARCGYFIYIIYGVIEWFRPGSPQFVRRRRQTLVGALLSVVLGSVVSWFIAACWQRRRPFASDGAIKAFIPHKANASFPSNHSALALSASLRLWQDHMPGAGGLFLWSLVIGFSRIYCGVHYATDVLGGFLLGLASHAAVTRSKTARKLEEGICDTWQVVEGLGKAWWRQW